MKNTNHYDLDLGLLLLSVASHNKGLAAHLTPQAKEATGIPLGSTSNWTMNFTPTVPSSPGFPEDQPIKHHAEDNASRRAHLHHATRAQPKSYFNNKSKKGQQTKSK